MTIDEQSALTLPPAPSRRRPRSRRRPAAVALVAALVLGSAGTYLATRTGQEPAPAGSTTFADPAAGFRLAYPSAWKRVTGPDGLLLEISAQNAVSVKKTTLAEAVDTTNLDAVRAVTDAVLSKPDAKLTILNSSATKVGGLPGISYLYTFSSGAEQGAHTHYFVFDGREMYTLVFQALPAADFTALAPTFDEVVESFGVLRK